MKKRAILILTFGLIMSFSGCKKTPSEDVYDTDKVVESTDENSGEVPVDTSKEDKNVDENGNEEEVEDKTVTDEVYEPEGTSEVEDLSELLVLEMKSSSIEDPEFKEKMKAFMEPFYYNIYFGSKDYTENGITEDDMVKFAIAYIHDQENQGLKFDTEKFILYVPEERVVELVDKYFGKKLSGHHSFEEENIEYNGGYYLMPATYIGWNETLRVDSIKESGDFSYEVVFTALDIEEKPIQSYKAMLEVRNDRLVLTGYTFADTPTDEQVETETEAEVETPADDDVQEDSDATEENVTEENVTEEDATESN